MLRAVARSSKAPVIGGVVLVVLLGVPLGVWLARGAIATSMAQDELAARGFTCDDRFSVSLSPGLGEATLGATRCEHEGGLLEAVELLGDVQVTLEGFEPASITAESVRVVLRDQDVRNGSGWSSELSRLSLEQRVAGLIKGIAELGAMSLPPAEISRVEFVRHDDPLAHGTGLRITPAGEGMQLALGDLSFSSTMGELRLSRLSGRAAADAVSLRGQASARVGIGILSVSRSGSFDLAATALDTASPRFRLTGSI